MRKVHFRLTIIGLLISLLLVGCSSADQAVSVQATSTTAKSPNTIPTVDSTTQGLIAQTRAALNNAQATQPETDVAAAPTAKPTSRPTVRPTVKPTTKPKATTSRLDCSRTLVGGVEPKLPSISLTDLYRCRPQAKSVVAAIKSNGPFEYDRDDIIFQNREGALPGASNGTYREYTVETPGASTRGTRRLITSGARNRQPAKYTALYYTDDHYETMWLVVEK